MLKERERMRVINISIDADTGKRLYKRNEVAVECGVSTQIIKQWEEANLIPHSFRGDNNYRYWSEEDLAKIKEYASTPRKERYGNLKKSEEL